MLAVMRRPDDLEEGPRGHPSCDVTKDWVAWHAAYDDSASSLSARLRIVRSRLSEAISQAPPLPVRLLSLCAGQGRDVLGVLLKHPRREAVRAVLVESDPRNAAVARHAAAEAGLTQIEVREADASLVASFADALPADVLLLCGIFGNLSQHDIRQTVAAAPGLCEAGATVLWTRHRRPPDLTPRIRAWFTEAGFEEMAFDEVEGETRGSVGVHRLRGVPAAPRPLCRQPLFRFGSA
jgi:predicted RNA methylase